MLPQVQEPTDSSVIPRRVAVIPLGGEFECAMTRGWIEALAGQARVEILTRFEHREILDVCDDPFACHGLGRGPLDLLRLANTLKRLAPDRAIRLDDTFAGRLLGTICAAEKRSISERESQRPAAIDAALASIFKTLGVDAPLRTGPLRLTTQTVRRARKLLAQFGLDRDQSIALYAPDAATTLKNQSIASPAELPGLPVVLMPPGEELDLIARLAGHAYLVRANDLALRAALIGRAGVLVSDHAPSIELAALMHTATEIPAGGAFAH